MGRNQLVDRYLVARAEKRALAEKFKELMEPLCAEIRELEARLDGCASCEGGCHAEPTKPKLSIVH